MKKKFKFILFTLITVFGISISTSGYTLVMPKSFYDAISWTYTYDAPATGGPGTPGAYNCLGYATGSMQWEWPWGGNNPTKSQVDTYLGNQIYGYKSALYGTPIANPLIIAYGSTSQIVHFSKVTSYGNCTAKWGTYERFVHGSLDPYYSTSPYGSAAVTYYK